MNDVGGSSAERSSRTVSWTDRRAPGRPLVIAHRGASAVEPENSLPAFARAARDGADGVELDVLLCASGEAVVFHDDDLARLGGRPDRIADVTLATLRGWRLLSGATIPTLEEVLDSCEGLLVNVELKASGLTGAGLRALVERVAAAIVGGGAELGGRILISSFSPRAVAWWQRRMPGVPAGLLFERQSPLPARRAWALPWLRPFSVHPQNVLCDARAVARWHGRGCRVHTWTVDAEAELRRFAEMGVDGIITNDPARARAALDDAGRR